jgi:trimethylamine--corrinoid protein Co-methyltransferase
MSRPGPAGGQYRPLTPEEVQRIHAAALTVLERVGLQVEHEEARALYRQAGAQVSGERVTLPPSVVEQALRQAPARVLLAGRDPEHDVVLEGERVYAGTGGSPAAVLDPGARAVRPARLADLIDMIRLADRLEHCDFVVLPLHPTDVPPEDVPVNRFYAGLTHTTRHVMGGVGSVEGAQQVIEMAALVAGGMEALQARPFVSAITCWLVSPLRLDPAVTDILLAWCRAGLPVVLSSAPMSGSTAPVTLAGTLVQLHAELLSGVVLTQTVRPGTPVIAGYVTGLADLRSGGYLGGAVEFGMMQAAAAQLAHFCRLPIYGSGGMSDSSQPDAQAGYEKMTTFLLAAMGGCNLIHHAIGMVANMSAVSLEQAVIDDEIVGMAQRVLRGLAVDDDRLAVEAIARVGPGGHYLADPHTIRFMRAEHFSPRLADRQGVAREETEGRDLRSRAAEQAARLLQEHPSPGLPPDAEAAIRARFHILLQPLPPGGGTPGVMGAVS